MIHLRVAQWATGGVGAIAFAAMARRADLEVVGVVVSDPAKVGRDAGELCGLGPLGVEATDDVDRVLALSPDAVCYAASGEARPGEAVDDLVRLLSAGVDVVSTSVPGLVHPAGFDADQCARLRAAAESGRATLYVSGIEPGFAADHLVLVLATLTRTITSVRTQELFSYADYPVTFTGRPPRSTGPTASASRATRSSRATSAWAPRGRPPPRAWWRRRCGS